METESARSRLRARQQKQQEQRLTSAEESICDDSSDDHLKLSHSTAPAATSKPNKRKRTDGGRGGSGSTTSTTTTTSSQLPTPTESSDERGTLDIFIPPPKDFTGNNNPFSSPASFRSANPFLSAVRPLKTRLSEKDIRITKTGEIKRRRLVRKWKRSQAGDLFLLNEPGFAYLQPNNPSSKESVLSYFGIAERIARGEKYSIHARRIPPSGPPQYLVQWETDKSAST